MWVAVAVAALLLKDASAVRTAPVETNDARQAEAEREYQLVQSKLLELEQDPEALFHNFVREHNKKYEDETERAYRLGVFKVSTTQRERESWKGNQDGHLGQLEKRILIFWTFFSRRTTC